MKTKIFLSSLLAVSLFMVSCKKELQPQESAAPQEAAVIDASSQQVPGNQPAAMPAQPVTVSSPAAQQIQPQATTTAPGMNPPHGQPNHRCDIAVGAPLNSPPGKNPAQAQAQAPVQAQPQMQPQASAPAVATAPGMNPPHGQPGHKCEVAVGAPLPK
ncbi:hypothetical protein ACFPVY_10795 [Flavobacterium qiangtangense]|uniref:Uncharacterized protein n=1 Tax=Flavobacterium qiangtangense TaxID=1442595 RepID=A0ABW1PNB8_9FLAO